MKRRTVIIVTILLIIIASAAALATTMPIDRYTTTRGCNTEPMPTVRLSLLRGGSLDDIKSADAEPVSPVEGCSQNAEYVLYFL